MGTSGSTSAVHFDSNHNLLCVVKVPRELFCSWLVGATNRWVAHRGRRPSHSTRPAKPCSSGLPLCTPPLTTTPTSSAQPCPARWLAALLGRGVPCVATHLRLTRNGGLPLRTSLFKNYTHGHIFTPRASSHDVFGVFCNLLPEKNGIFHSSSLKQNCLYLQMRP